jgi:hypothetical protein
MSHYTSLIILLMSLHLLVLLNLLICELLRLILGCCYSDSLRYHQVHRGQIIIWLRMLVMELVTDLNFFLSIISKRGRHDFHKGLRNITLTRDRLEIIFNSVIY